MKHPNTPTRPARRIAGAVLAIGALGLLTVGCGDDDETTDTTAPPATTVAAETTAAPAEGEVLVEGAWARTSPMSVEIGAAYMTITSPVDDKLVGAAVDAGVAGTVEIHETVMSDGGMGSDTTMGMGGDMGASTTMGMGGEMTMRPVEFIELPAGTAVELKPGGYHLMLIDLVAPLELGTTLQITLTFEVAGEVVVEVPVLEEAP